MFAGKGPGPWIYVPLALAVAACGFGMQAGWDASMRLVFGLLGGLWAAVVLFRASRSTPEARGPLTLAALAMTVYAVAAGGSFRGPPSFHSRS